MRTILPLLAFALPISAAAQSVAGPATAIDGDSLTVSGVDVRLFGVDAPEGKQTCERDGQAWPCGEAATQQLRELISGKRVSCSGRGRDSYGRVLALCSAGYNELNKIMVEQGWATAFRKFSQDYVAAETRAKQAGLGIWTSTFVPPEQFRQAHQPAEPEPLPAAALVRARPRAQQAPAALTSGCVIKGNHSRRGEWIYHLPGMPYYDATRAEEIFCTEAQAQAAGYRRAKVR